MNIVEYKDAAGRPAVNFEFACGRTGRPHLGEGRGHRHSD
jgi:hypothetical protein